MRKLTLILLSCFLTYNFAFAAEETKQTDAKKLLFGNFNDLEKKSEKLKDKYQEQKLSFENVDRIVTNGKGVWVNVWNYPTDVNAFISRLKNFNINTVYLQINRSTTEVFKNKAGLDAILKAAHQENIKIIGWSYCYLNDVITDAKKFIEPALYISPDGERLDGMAADIEENTALWAVRSYTEKIKNALPKDYPLIAIVYSPKVKTQYPWEYIANNWDVMMPMTYWHGLKNRDHDTVYNFVKDSIVQLRALTKKDDLKIHLITDGDHTNAEEIMVSLRAAKDLNINAGISIYPEHLASDEMLKALDHHCREDC